MPVGVAAAHMWPVGVKARVSCVTAVRSKTVTRNVRTRGHARPRGLRRRQLVVFVQGIHFCGLWFPRLHVGHLWYNLVV